MPWKITAELLFLAPFSLLWLAFVAHEASKAVAAIKGGRRHG